MGQLVDFRRRPKRPRPPDASTHDKWEILTVGPARPGWTAYILAFDDATDPDQLRSIWWREPIAAWGHVEWTWAADVTPRIERYWEALVAESYAGNLVPAITYDDVGNIVEVVVLGPDEAPPEWAGGGSNHQAVAERLVDEYLKPPHKES